MKFEHKGKWLAQITESLQKNEATSDRVNINVYYDGKKISSLDIRNYLPSNYNITKITAKPEVIAKAQKNESFRVEVKPTYLSKVDTKGMTKTFNTEKEAIAYHSKLEKTDAYKKGKISIELWINNESSQKNETSLRDLNLDLSEDTNAVIASVDKIRQRFEYRTLQNQSYDEKQAEKIYLEIRRELEKAKKLIDACYNKIG